MLAGTVFGWVVFLCWIGILAYMMVRLGIVVRDPSMWGWVHRHRALQSNAPKVDAMGMEDVAYILLPRPLCLGQSTYGYHFNSWVGNVVSLWTGLGTAYDLGVGPFAPSRHPKRFTVASHSPIHTHIAAARWRGVKCR